MHIISIKDVFHKNTDKIKNKKIKKKIMIMQDFQTAALWQCLDQCWWKVPILEGSLIQKPTLIMN